MKKIVDWNINYYVTVKLTEFGLEIFKNYHSQYDKTPMFKPMTENKIAEIIANNYELRLQGWKMMQIFGSECYLGSKPVFHECIWKTEIEE